MLLKDKKRENAKRAANEDLGKQSYLGTTELLKDKQRSPPDMKKILDPNTTY